MYLGSVPPVGWKMGRVKIAVSAPSIHRVEIVETSSTRRVDNLEPGRFFIGTTHVALDTDDSIVRLSAFNTKGDEVWRGLVPVNLSSPINISSATSIPHARPNEEDIIVSFDEHLIPNILTPSGTTLQTKVMIAVVAFISGCVLYWLYKRNRKNVSTFGRAGW